MKKLDITKAKMYESAEVRQERYKKIASYIVQIFDEYNITSPAAFEILKLAENEVFAIRSRLDDKNMRQDQLYKIR